MKNMENTIIIPGFYDLTLDTTATPAEACSQKVIEYIETGEPTSFSRLIKHFGLQSKFEAGRWPDEHGMHIRTALVPDIPAIQMLYQELDRHHVDILPQYFQKVDGDIRTDESIAQWIASDDKAYFVAEADGGIVGFASVAERTHPAQPMYRKHRYALIDNAVVAMEYRGRGIGQDLFDAVAEWARRKGIATAQVQVWNANRGAYRFYLRQGFNPITMRMELPLSHTGQATSLADCEKAAANA